MLSNWNRRLWNKLKSPMQAQSKIHWKVNPKEGINGNLASGLSLKSYWPPTHHPTNPSIYLMRTRLVTRPWWFSSSTRGAQLIGVILAAGQHYTRQPLEATPLWSLVNRLLDTCSHLSPVLMLLSSGLLSNIPMKQSNKGRVVRFWFCHLTFNRNMSQAFQKDFMFFLESANYWCYLL